MQIIVFTAKHVYSAKRRIAIVSHASAYPPVYLFVCNVDIPWAHRLDSSKVITRIIGLGSHNIGNLVQGEQRNTPKIRVE